MHFDTHCSQQAKRTAWHSTSSEWWILVYVHCSRAMFHSIRWQMKYIFMNLFPYQTDKTALHEKKCKPPHSFQWECQHGVIRQSSWTNNFITPLLKSSFLDGMLSPHTWGNTPTLTAVFSLISWHLCLFLDSKKHFSDLLDFQETDEKMKQRLSHKRLYSTVFTQWLLPTSSM